MGDSSCLCITAKNTCTISRIYRITNKSILERLPTDLYFYEQNLTRIDEHRSTSISLRIRRYSRATGRNESNSIRIRGVEMLEVRIEPRLVRAVEKKAQSYACNRTRLTLAANPALTRFVLSGHSNASNSDA